MVNRVRCDQVEQRRNRVRTRRVTLGVPAALLTLTVALVRCSEDDAPVATFDGSDCTYEGPAEFAIGDTVTFTF